MPNSSGLIQIKRDLIKIGGTSLTAADWTAILKALIDDSIKGILRSIGDSGDSPSNVTGKTLLRLLNDLYTRTRVLDANTGTQVVKHASGTYDTTVIVHTVTSGKIFYLTYANVLHDGGFNVSLQIKDTSDVTVARVIMSREQGQSSIFIPPIKIAEGYDIVLVIGGTSGNGYCTILGWEE